MKYRAIIRFTRENFEQKCQAENSLQQNCDRGVWILGRIVKFKNVGFHEVGKTGVNPGKTQREEEV